MPCSPVKLGVYSTLVSVKALFNVKLIDGF